MEAQRAIIADLLKQGKTAREIADLVKRSLTAVQADIRAVQGEGAQRSPDERKFDRVLITRLRLQGLTQTEIAETVGLSPATISREFKAIDREWRESPISNLNAIKNELMFGYRNVIRIAYEELDKSTGVHVKRKVKRDTGNGEGADADTTTEVQTEEITGDPRYLRVITESLEAIAKLTGANAPSKLEHTGADGGPIDVRDLTNFTDAELEAFLKQR